MVIESFCIGYPGGEAIFDPVFGQEKLEVLYSLFISLIHPDNAPSRRVAEKLGEKIEGETEVLTMPVLVYASHRPE